MRELLDQVIERFDMVLLDSPPVLAVTDACALAAAMDGVIFVVGSGKIPFGALRRAKAQIESAQGRVLGAVVNQFEAHSSDGYSKAYYQRYYGRDR
jgi:Mrp family chromosome partitioning ATPase